MKKARAKAAPPRQANEGEGSRTAARHYNAGVRQTVRSGHIDEKGRQAARALEGPEGPELRKAEEEAKHHLNHVVKNGVTP
jgi:hypothetical protein